MRWHNNKRMRFNEYQHQNEYQQKVTRTAAAKLFGPQAEIWLFVSRIDDHQAKGGNLDFLIWLDRPVKQRGRMLSLLAAGPQCRLGVQPIDVLLPALAAVHAEALRQGIKLWCRTEETWRPSAPCKHWRPSTAKGSTSPAAGIVSILIAWHPSYLRLCFARLRTVEPLS